MNEDFLIELNFKDGNLPRRETRVARVPVAGDSILFEGDSYEVASVSLLAGIGTTSKPVAHVLVYQL